MADRAAAMNIIAINDDDYGPAGSKLRLVNADAGQLNCHVSPVVYQIRDYGPAIVNGEVYKDRTAAGSGRSKAADSAAHQAATEPAGSQRPARGANKTLMGLALLLAVAVASVSFYAWQQKLHMNDLQAELKLHDDMNEGI